MKTLICALSLFLSLNAFAGKKAMDMTQQEYNAYVKARISNISDEEDRENVAKRYEADSAAAARGEKVMTTDEAHKAKNQEKYEEEKYGSEEVQVEQGRFFDKLEGKN